MGRWGRWVFFLVVVGCLVPAWAWAEVRFTDFSRFVLGACGDVEEALLAEDARKVAPQAGQGRVAVYGTGVGKLRREVYVVCYGEDEFQGTPAADLNGRVAAILIRYAEPLDDLQETGTVYGGSHLSVLNRSALGLYARKEMPEYYRMAPHAFVATYADGLGVFRAASFSRVFAAAQGPQPALELRVQWRSYGYQDRVWSPQVHLVSDFLMGPKGGRALPFSWDGKDLGDFALVSLKAWVQELLAAGR